ncbi:spherulation-specific family 4 protein [Streptomyces sp. NPDC006283]|uniref:spherulation-specific family 4 protein n=1 Tax=Streptomyces sp. NPDC006283 TaxID=3156741 RepID=UPI0033AD2D50
MKLLVPLYVHPSVDPAAWRTLVDRAPVLYGVVLNAADGPGRTPDAAFARAARELRSAGVRVLGYVDTDYGRRSARAVAADYERHRAWYDTDGFFLDQVAPDQAGVRHYRRLARTARAHGGATLALNPGVHPAPGYASFADLLVTFEGGWEAYRTAPAAPPWTRGHPPGAFCHLVHGVPSGLSGLAARTAELRGAAVHCAVTGHGPNPWSSLPPALRNAS